MSMVAVHTHVDKRDNRHRHRSDHKYMQNKRPRLYSILAYIKSEDATGKVFVEKDDAVKVAQQGAR